MLLVKVLVRVDDLHTEQFDDADTFDVEHNILMIRRSRTDERSVVGMFYSWQYARYIE